MKNSLLKRAIAAASVVPVALTQCLSVANAVYVDSYSSTAVKGAAGSSMTLNNGDATSILYIAPKNDYAEVDGTYVKSSDWNVTVSSLIASVAAGDKSSDVIDMSKAYETAIEKSGEYAEVTKSLIEKMSDIAYNVEADGKITVTASLDNITPTFTAGGNNTIGGALKELAAKYGVEDLDTPDNFFEDVVIAGDLEIVINANMLADGTTVEGTLKFTDKATGNVYYGLGVIDWALEKFDLLKSTAKEACDKYSQYVDTTDAYAEIEDSVAFYVDKLELAKEYIAKGYAANKSLSADAASEIIAKADKILFNKKGKHLPGTTCLELASNAKALEIYNDALAQANDKTPVTIDIQASELGAFGDSIYDIEVSLINGVATISGKFADTETEWIDVEDYIEEKYNVDAVSSYKQFTAVADASKFTNEGEGFASADFQLERVVIVKETTTTTTTTSTTTSSTTTTTSTVSDDVTTTTTTEPTVSDITTPGFPGPTTTTVSDDGSGTTTTTTATETDLGDHDCTTTSTVSDGGASDVTTTSTVSDGGDVSVTTTTVSDGGDVSTPTTTSTVSDGGDVSVTTTTVSDGGDVSTPTTTSTVSDGGDVSVTTTTVSDGGDVSTPTTTSTVSDGGDVSVTTTTVSDGGDDTSTTTRTETKYVVNYHTETQVGFYLDIDPEFNIDQVKSLGYSIDYSVLSYGEDGALIKQEILEAGEVVDITDSIEFKDVPADVFKLINTEAENQFAAQIQIYATKQIVNANNEVIAEAGEALKNIDGSPVSATAYIGVKGDADLDMVADASDASTALVYYAKISTGAVASETQFSTNNVLVANDPVLDDFAAFLADVDNENDSNNYVALKPARVIDASDASFILGYYAKISTGRDTGRDTWNDVLGVYGKYND